VSVTLLSALSDTRTRHDGAAESTAEAAIGLALDTLLGW
jgi:hypothetical protein